MRIFDAGYGFSKVPDTPACVEKPAATIQKTALLERQGSLVFIFYVCFIYASTDSTIISLSNISSAMVWPHRLWVMKNSQSQLKTPLL